jgi:hypothetical protein
LLQLGCEVKVASTKSALYFFNQQQLPEAVGPIAGDEDEWHEWKAVGDPVLHIGKDKVWLAGVICDSSSTCQAQRGQ